MKEKPSWVKRLDVYEVEFYHRKFWGLCRPAMERLDDDPCAEFIWPREGMSARAVPADIHPLSRERGFDHEEKLERFFSEVSPSGLIFWDYDVHHIGSYLGPYNRDMRIWVARELVATTWCVISPDADLAVIMQHELEASMIVGSPAVIAHLDNVFGGSHALRAEFIAHVEGGGFFWGAQYAPWAYQYIFPKCGWEIP